MKTAAIGLMGLRALTVFGQSVPLPPTNTAAPHGMELVSYYETNPVPHNGVVALFGTNEVRITPFALCQQIPDAPSAVLVIKNQTIYSGVAGDLLATNGGVVYDCAYSADNYTGPECYQPVTSTDLVNWVPFGGCVTSCSPNITFRFWMQTNPQAFFGVSNLPCDGQTFTNYLE